MNLNKIRKLAEAATPGPWHTANATKHPGKDGYRKRIVAYSDPRGPTALALVDTLPTIERYANAAYIAALSPERILAMLDVIEAADAMRVYFGDMGECEAYDAARKRLGEME